MLTGIRQKTVVNNGKVELFVPELSEGTEVEIILLIEPNLEEDETTYLLKSEANKKHLLEAIERVKNQENLDTFTSEEWHEKYSI